MTVIDVGIRVGDPLLIPAGEFLFDENAVTVWIPCKPRDARVVAVIGPVCHIEGERALGQKTFSRVATLSASRWKI